MVRDKFKKGAAAAFIPAQRSLAALQKAAADCRACPLWALTF